MTIVEYNTGGWSREQIDALQKAAAGGVAEFVQLEGDMCRIEGDRFPELFTRMATQLAETVVPRDNGVSDKEF